MYMYKSEKWDNEIIYYLRVISELIMRIQRKKDRHVYLVPAGSKSILQEIDYIKSCKERVIRLIGLYVPTVWLSL